MTLQDVRIINETIFLPETSVPPIILNETDLYTAFEHCLAHFAYETNTMLAEICADDFSRRWDDRDLARNLYMFIWQLLEDERVESLWCMIYEGSKRRFAVLKKRQMLRTVMPPLDAVLAVRGGIEYHGSFPEVYEESRRRFERVRCADVDAPLVEARKLCEFLLNNYDIKLLPDVKIEVVTSDRDEVPSDVDDSYINESRKRAWKRVELLRSKIANPKPGKGPFFRMLEFQDEEPFSRYGAVIRERPRRTSEIPQNMLVLARKIATKLRFVREKYVGGLDVEGDTVDLQAYINWRASKMRDEPEIFESWIMRRRASVVILFDMSSSMTSRGAYNIAKRVSTVLSLAAAMARGVAVRVMEFGSNSRGETKVVVASRPEEVAGMRPDPSYYLTPIHVALMVARCEISSMPGAKMVVLVSDGEPCYEIDGKEVSYKTLSSWVAEERRKMALEVLRQQYTEEGYDVVLDEESGWVRVRNEAGEEGWIPGDRIEPTRGSASP